MRRMRGLIIFSYFLIFLFLMTVSSNSILANPIPSEIPREGRSGGDPLPIPYEYENLSVYLKEEVIKAKLYENHADIKAEYTFYSEDTTDDEIEICLPFINEPWDVIITCNGNQISFKGYAIYYETIARSHYFEFDHEFLSCKIFTIPIVNNSETTISVTYKSAVSKYDSALNSEIRYYFSYLVGTARYWNHTIDQAHFEFRISDDLYDSEKIIRWNRTKKGDEFIFTLTYYNWTPTKDLVSFSWEKDRGFFEELERKYQMEWNHDEFRIYIYSCCGISLLLIIQFLMIIYVVRKKIRKERKQ